MRLRAIGLGAVSSPVIPGVARDGWMSLPVGRSRALPTSTVSPVARMQGIRKALSEASEKSGSREQGDSAVLSVLPVRVEARLRAGKLITDVHGLLSEGLGQVCIDSGRLESVGLGLLVGIDIANARDACHPHRRHAHRADRAGC